ncbi:MAG: hypothetical protein JST21_01135 [Bacteroidetes bacterium]|nr:hypothetical protein [Bacteroidota bacterium]
MKPLHHINKVTLDFTFSQKDKNISLQKAKHLFYDYALKQIENSLEETDETIYIDKLEIDLGVITEDVFAEKFFSALSEALSKYFQKEIKVPSAIATKAEKLLSVDDVMFFLNSGYWPWHIQNRKEKVIQSLINGFFLNREQIFSVLKKISISDKIVVHRLLNIIWKEKKLFKFFVNILIEKHSFFKRRENFIENIFAKYGSATNNVMLIFFQKLLTASPIDTVTGFKMFMLECIHVFNTEISESSYFYKVLQDVRLLFEKRKLIVQGLLNATEKILAIINREAEPVFEYIINEPELYFTREIENKIHIDNAGLILLHPYLPIVFKELGWTEAENNFINIHCQQKAILFLQFIVNGKSKQSEHLLVLNKILCGWPVVLPMKNRVVFSPAEKQAAADVLDSLIEHWAVLRNTSRRGLIESFISRKGLIEKTNDGFVVQVEKNSIDILLDSLPFGINTIKLPWNEYLVYTEWQF